MLVMNESFTVSDEYVNVSSSSCFELSSPIHLFLLKEVCKIAVTSYGVIF